MSYTRTDDALLAGFLNDQETALWFSVTRDCDAMIRFESALAAAQGASGLIPVQAATEIERACRNFEPDISALAMGAARDGVVPPALVAQLRSTLDEAAAPSLHKGATSQDLIDTSLMMRMAELVPELSNRTLDVVNALDAIAQSADGEMQLMAHTRMQRALPFTLADKINTWTTPLKNACEDSPDYFPLQLGGPVGTLSAMGDQGESIAAHMGQALGLAVPARCWHTDRTPVITIATWAAGVTNALGKVGQDMALMGQNEVGELTVTGGGKSSAMAHKNNPVAAEALITLARFSATMMGGLHQAALHENERSGGAWTLEWMLFPQLIIATGTALANASRLIETVQFNPSA